jgi:sensor histidine kinase regulating citrate/malate metabolism
MARSDVPRLGIPLWVRLAVPISLIIALAISLITFLNYYNYEKTYRQLNVSRITVVARDLRQAIEVGLNVGLAPRNNTELDKGLALAKEHTEGLRFAAVIDDQGKRLVEVGQAAPGQGWLSRLAGIGDASSWLGEDSNTYQVGLPYRNSFGVTVGAVVVGYDKAAIDRATAAMRLNLLGDWAVAVTLLTILTLFGVRLVTRPLESELSVAEAALANSLASERISEPHLPVLGKEIEYGIPAFIKKSRVAAETLAAPGSPLR